MGRRSVAFYVPVPLLFAACFFFPRSVDAATEALIDSICKTTSDIDFCRGVFMDDPRVTVADTNGLLVIAISQATENVSDTADKIPPLLKAAGSDGVEKRRLTECAQDYAVAKTKFHEAFGAASKRDYFGVIDSVRDGTNPAIACGNVYRTGPPVKDSPIAGDISALVKYAGVIFASVGYLVEPPS